MNTTEITITNMGAVKLCPTCGTPVFHTPAGPATEIKFNQIGLPYYVAGLSDAGAVETVPNAHTTARCEYRRWLR
jgi:hypothetical protein